MTRPASNPPDRYLMPSEVAKLLNVAPKTIAKWSQEGKLPFVRTLGGHRRYPESEIRALRSRLQTPVDNLDDAEVERVRQAMHNGGAGR